MADLNDNIEKLYRALEKEGFEDIGTPEEFREYVGDSANISNLHKALAGAGYDDIGSEKEFSDWLNEGKQAETAVPQQQTQPYDANGNVLTHNGQPYSQEVLRRYYSPENKEGNFRDLATIADQVDNERSVSRMQTTGGAGYVPPQQFSIAPEQQQPAAQRSVSKEDAERFATETQTPLRPKPYVDQPFKEKAEELQQMSKAPNLSQGWANLTAEEQRIIADPNKDFGQKMQAMQDAQTVENARRMNRKEYDSNNFDKFYDEHVSPVFTEERKAGEKKAREEIDSLPKDTGGGLLSKAIQTVKSDIATEKHTDPEKIANQTLKRVEDDDSFGNYILNRMGINGNGSDEGDSPQLTEAEKEMMKALFSKETGEVAGQIIDRMYETYRKENAPKDVLHYITGKAFQENLMSQLYQSMITRVANSSGMRQQLRQMAYEEFGKDQSWWTRVAGGAAPFAVDMIAGGFALPNVVGQAVVKGGVGLAAKEVTQQMAQRAAARGLEGAALKEAVSGAAGVAERYLATQAPIMNLAIRAAGSAANFATYDVQSEIVRQIASGEFKPVDLMKAAAHGAVLGGAMGTVGGAIGRATRNASLAGKVAGNAAGVGAETALFGISSGLQKAIDDGIDIQDVDWADTTGEAFGTVVGMKAVGAAMHPKDFLNRYRKSKDYDLQLNQRDLDELKAAGYDFDGLFKGLGKFGEVAPEKANITRDAEEVGKPGKSAKVEEAYVDQEAYKNILQNPEVSSNTKRKLVYVATGVILKPEPVFGATMDVDDNGHATITTLNAYGNPIETKDYKTEEEAQKEYKNLQEISQTNTIGGLERIAKEANMPYVVDEAKGRTKNETGVDVDDLDQLSSLDEDHLNMVMDAYVKNLQESYMEGFNAKLKKIEQQATEAPKQTDGGEAIREGYSPITQGYSEIREGYSEGNPPSDGGEPPAGTAGGGTGTQAGSSGTPATRSERRDAAYRRGSAVAEDETQLAQIGYDRQKAAARMFQQLPDNNPVAARVRNGVIQAVQNGDVEGAETLLEQSAQLLTPEQREAVDQYLDAIETQTGVEDAAVMQTEAFETQRREQLQVISDPQGNVTPLLLNDGRTVYYKSGDLDNHYGGVMAVDENGEAVQVSVRQITEIGQPQNIDAILEAETENFYQQTLDRYGALSEGMPLQGQQVDMILSGQPVRAIYNGEDTAGNSIFQLEDGSAITLNPQDAMQAAAEANQAKIQAELKAEADAAVMQQQTQRFESAIKGYKEGQPDLSATETDAKTAADYIRSQLGADAKEAEKARKQQVADIQNAKEQMDIRRKEAEQELRRLEQWLRGNEDIAEPQEVEDVRQKIVMLQDAIADLAQRQQKWTDIRLELMSPEERTQMEQQRRRDVFNARRGYKPQLESANVHQNADRLYEDEDGKLVLGLSAPGNVNNYLLKNFEDAIEAEKFMNQQRLDLRNQQRDVVQPEINRLNDLLNQYTAGHADLTTDEIKDIVTQVADLEARQDALSDQAARLRDITEGIPALYERNRPQQQLTPAEQRGKEIDKASSREDKIRIAQNVYGRYPEAADIIADQEPRDLDEFVAANLGLGSMNWEGFDQGERHIIGVQEALFGKNGGTRGIGKQYSTNAFNQYLAPTGEGKGFADIVHDIYESQPDIGDSKRWTTEDISDALLDLLRTAQKPSDISHRIIDNRIAEAEGIVRQQEEYERELEEQAKTEEMQQWADAHHLDPEERETFEEYLKMPPTEPELEVINQIIAENEEKQNTGSEGVDSQHPGGAAGADGEDGQSIVQGQGTGGEAGGNQEQQVVVGGAEAGNGEPPVPDTDVSGGGGTPGERGGVDETKGEDLMHVPFAERLKAAKGETNTNPTDAQKEAGNYKMGHVRFGGYRMSIENPKGSTRSGVDRNGKPWSINMKDTYGYIGKKYGTDGDHLDFFINDDADLDEFAGRVFIVDQKNEDGTFDEHKVMYGYPTWSRARKAYERNYEPGWWDRHVMQMTGVKKAVFDKWLADSDHKTKPFAEYYRTRMSETVSNPADQLLADVEEREKAAILADIKPWWDEKAIARKTDDELSQLREKARKDIGTANVLLGTTNIEKGSEKEMRLKIHKEQARVNIEAIDKEMERRRKERQDLIEDAEEGSYDIMRSKGGKDGKTDQAKEFYEKGTDVEYENDKGEKRSMRIHTPVSELEKIQPVEVKPHSLGRDELKSMYQSFEPETNAYTGETVRFYNSAFNKNHRDGGLFEKIVPQIRDIFKESRLIYSEPENLGGTVRPDGTKHKEHRDIQGYGNYLNRVTIDGKDYYVRFTVQRKKGESGLHSSFVSNVKVYENPAEVAYGLSHGEGRLDFDRISDAKLRIYFEKSKEIEEKNRDLPQIKEKAPDYLHHSTPIVATSESKTDESQDDVLNSAAKIVKDFENPTISDENLRKTYAKYVDAAEETAEMLGGMKVVFESEGPEEGTLGWYDPNNNTIHVVLPEHADADEVKRTVCHEKLGHEGLVALLGSQSEVNKFGQFIFGSASKDLRKRIMQRADEEGYKWDDPLRHSKAAQEVFADIAAEGPKTADEFSLWTKVKHYLIKLLNKLNLRIRGLLNDHDLRYYVLKTGEALKKWNSMEEEERSEASRQETNFELMRSRGKPRKKKDESWAQYLHRLREYEMQKLKEEAAKANNDPIPERNAINERYEKEYQEALAEWKRANGIPEEEQGAGAFPKREPDETPQDYAKRVADFETASDKWKEAPSYFDYMQKANDEYSEAYDEWMRRNDIREEENVDLNLYEGRSQNGPQSYEELDADSRALADLADDLGADISPEGAVRTVKEAIIDRRASLNDSNFKDARFIHDIRKRMNEEAKLQGVKPSVLREAMPDIIEGTYFEEVLKDKDGNVVAINDISDKVPIKKTDGLQQILAEIKQWYDEMFFLLEQEGLRGEAGYIPEGYINHIWDKGKSDKEAWQRYIETHQRQRSPNMKHREIDTYREGRDVGLVQKFKDVTDIMSYYSVSNNEAIANSRMLRQLSCISVEERSDSGELLAVLPLLNSHEPEFDAASYESFYINQGKQVWVHKAVSQRFANIFGSKAVEGQSDWESKLFYGYDLVSSTAKKSNLSLSFFHAGALFEVYMAQAMSTFGPVRAIKNLGKYLIIDTARKRELPAYANPEDAREAAAHLVKLGATDDYAAADVLRLTAKLRTACLEWMKDGNVAKKIAGYSGIAPAAILDFLNSGMDNFLWSYLHDGLKIAMFKMYSENLHRSAEKNGWNDETLNRMLNEAGQYVNDVFGGQFWEVINVSPHKLKLLKFFLLSPDWLVSTGRHALATAGFGSIYNDSGFWNYMQYNGDNLKRLFGKDVPKNKERWLRSASAILCYAVGIMGWKLFWEAINVFFRKHDVEKELQHEKDEPGYVSKYRLIYPDGMKWTDYLMSGNAVGKKSYVFVGRYSDGTEKNVRWGKQFREVPEYFEDDMGRFEFPAPIVKRLYGKSNPIIRQALADFIYMNDFYSSNKDKEKKAEFDDRFGRVLGRTFGVAWKTKDMFLPFLFSDTNKEFSGWDLVMPTSKGLSKWKAQDYFKQFILAGDQKGIEATYRSCVQNGIDPMEQYKAAYGSLRALESRQFMDGVVTVEDAAAKFDASIFFQEKAAMKKHIQKLIGAEDFEQINIEDFRLKLREMEEDEPGNVTIANQTYTMMQTSEDAITDAKISVLAKRAKETEKELKTMEAQSDLSSEQIKAWMETPVIKRLLEMSELLKEYKTTEKKSSPGYDWWRRQLGSEPLKLADGTVEDDAYRMKMIRDLRKEMLDKIDSLEP